MTPYDIFYNEEFMRQHRHLIADAERAVIVSTPTQRRCPTCGGPLPASTPAAPAALQPSPASTPPAHPGPRFAPQHIQVQYEDGVYEATCAGASGFGSTPEAALRDFRAAYHRLQPEDEALPSGWRSREKML